MEQYIVEFETLAQLETFKKFTSVAIYGTDKASKKIKIGTTANMKGHLWKQRSVNGIKRISKV